MSGERSWWRRPEVAAILTFAAVGAVYLVVNALSFIQDRAVMGQPIPAWRPWSWEASSYVAWLLLAPVVISCMRRWPPRLSGPWIAGCVGFSIVLSATHSALMWLLRTATYAGHGLTYRIGQPVLDWLVYEYRKDAITMAAIAAAFLVAARLLAAKDPATETVTVELRDGPRIVRLRPVEIDWISAAGNYVEVHGALGTVLSRRTLSDLHEQLEQHGFVRVHRSRLVRRDAIAKVASRPSGDFDLALRSGETLVGSRRYRGAFGL